MGNFCKGAKVNTTSLDMKNLICLRFFLQHSLICSFKREGSKLDNNQSLILHCPSFYRVPTSRYSTIFLRLCLLLFLQFKTKHQHYIIFIWFSNLHLICRPRQNFRNSNNLYETPGKYRQT